MKRKVMRALAGLCAFLVIGSSAGAEIYKWRDSNGTLKFGDTMPSGVQYEKIEEVEESKPFQVEQNVKQESNIKNRTDNIELVNATVILKIQSDSVLMHLRPEVINKNNNNAKVRVDVSFYNYNKVEIHKSGCFFFLSGNTQSTNPTQLDFIMNDAADVFDVYTIRYIVARYYVFEEDGQGVEKTLNNVKLERI